MNYTDPNFEPSKLTAASLRKILAENDIPFSLNAKKKELLSIFKKEINNINATDKNINLKNSQTVSDTGSDYEEDEDQNEQGQHQEGGNENLAPEIVIKVADINGSVTPKKRKLRKSARASQKEVREDANKNNNDSSSIIDFTRESSDIDGLEIVGESRKSSGVLASPKFSPSTIIPKKRTIEESQKDNNENGNGNVYLNNGNKDTNNNANNAHNRKFSDVTDLLVRKKKMLKSDITVADDSFSKNKRSFSSPITDKVSRKKTTSVSPHKSLIIDKFESTNSSSEDISLTQYTNTNITATNVLDTKKETNANKSGTHHSLKNRSYRVLSSTSNVTNMKQVEQCEQKEKEEIKTDISENNDNSVIYKPVREIDINKLKFNSQVSEGLISPREEKTISEGNGMAEEKPIISFGQTPTFKVNNNNRSEFNENAFTNDTPQKSLENCSEEKMSKSISNKEDDSVTEKQIQPKKKHKAKKNFIEILEDDLKEEMGEEVSEMEDTPELEENTEVSTATNLPSMYDKLLLSLIAVNRFLFKLLIKHLLFSMILLPTLYGLWYRENKIKVGYCNHEMETTRYGLNLPFLNTEKTTKWINSEYPKLSFFSNFFETIGQYVEEHSNPQCVPCPDNALCYPYMELRCKPDYIKKPMNWLSLYGLLPIGGECVRDPAREHIRDEMVTKALELLRVKNAQYECGESEDDELCGLTDLELYQIFYESKKPWVKDDEFNEIWEAVSENLKNEPEIKWRQCKDTIEKVDYEKEIISNKKEWDTSSIGAFRSTSKKYTGFRCRFEREIFKTYREHRNMICCIILLFVFIKWLKYRLSNYYKEQDLVNKLVIQVLVKLQKTKKNYESDYRQYRPTTADGDKENRISIMIVPYLSTVQLRDLLLKDVVNLRLKNKIWNKVVKKLEGNNTNVKSSLMEVHGEIMKVWEWIGSISYDDNDESNN
ncbi:uncharacterized protein SCODWIG_01197 [Saccharomycodes ludwigii]|uniref:Inner nuclear membrane protein SRC1 n=1 Tax=Saccharomycodes ludwigii TaxID=36035 RepID=A0A376B418_9ASCO|nr:uncharacterized protein SCODWIG_01197 [Saccharomycodes ludwigii]